MDVAGCSSDTDKMRHRCSSDTDKMQYGCSSDIDKMRQYRQDEAWV